MFKRESWKLIIQMVISVLTAIATTLSSFFKDNSIIRQEWRRSDALPFSILPPFAPQNIYRQYIKRYIKQGAKYALLHLSICCVFSIKHLFSQIYSRRKSILLKK